MYSEQDLTDATAAGVIAPGTAEALRSFVADRRATPAADEEQVRLVTSFNDIFVAIAGLVLLVATSALLADPLGNIATAAAAWGLAEYFTRQRRMALPSILFLAFFASGVFGATFRLLAMAGLPAGTAAGQQAGYTVALAGVVTAAAAFLHWRRFHVPITVAAGAAAVVATLGGLVSGVLDVEFNQLLPFFIILGAATFAFAMWWDASDVARRTRRSDVAFWLHLLSAPLIVHPIFALLGVFSGDLNALTAVLVVVIYVTLGAVALVIDRRALMVSALAYVLYAIYTLLDAGGLGTSFALTGVLIGSSLLLLSALWQRLRRPLVVALPAAWQARVPPAIG
ncbi:hypothetical protein GGR88_001527 [Sphingomonas jejuensis]|uniref:Branched-chain amino acid ABC-type transport system, permease components n=1 Tax=Sphingomonas jejuensis TaxID=904715 RepID=A0ABX0XL03_9SPHN|nr:hypothetical protein [Sphingomonas jejuensis]NJC34053.1 hypothetical protein [Sphingomonas jejuensis]